MEDVHSIPDLLTPEKERVPDEIADLQLTPVNGKRSEDVSEQTERVYKCPHLYDAMPLSKLWTKKWSMVKI